MKPAVLLSERFWTITPAEYAKLRAARALLNGNPDMEVLTAQDGLLRAELERALAADEPELESTGDPVEDAVAARNAAWSAHRTMAEYARASLVAEWRQRGGCPHCRGRGWVVLWDTLDSLSGAYAEYGRCPAESGADGSVAEEYRQRFDVAPGARCTAESRRESGYEPCVSEPYDGNRGVADPLAQDAHPATVMPNGQIRIPGLTGVAVDLANGEPRWIQEARARFHQLLAPFHAQLRDAKEAERAARAACEIRKGRTVEVFKGRKVPVGTRGVVIWLGAGAYGARVGVKDASGTVHWTSATNVRVVLGVPEVKLERGDRARADAIDGAAAGQQRNATDWKGGR
jgi:hypothetical protein